MCGIVGYVGTKEVAPLLVTGLQRVEYRGYDSAGFALLTEERKIYIEKCVGKVANLNRVTRLYQSCVGIAHTRWATHGEPSEKNAHPHTNTSGDIAIVHNGIIENYLSLRKLLVSKGYTFQSDTDSEVLAHLIDFEWAADETMSLEESVCRALHHVEGAYGLCVISSRDPEKIVAARSGSPVVIGIGQHGYFVASDPSSFVGYADSMEFLKEGELAIITESCYEVTSLRDRKMRENKPAPLDMTLQEIEKGGSPHFMLKEIFEQPGVIVDVMRGRVTLTRDIFRLGCFEDYPKALGALKGARRIVICACGTSWHAGLIAEYLIETLARIPVEVEYASEFRYRDPVIEKEDVVIVFSQSGETADTRAALELAKERGAIVMGVVNTVGSSIAQETHCGIYLHAGHEIGVASTKAFTGQVTVATLLALFLAGVSLG